MMPDGYMWHKNDATFQGNRGRSYRSRCTFVRYGLYICQQILSLAGSPPQESLGRATGLLIRSVKSNKELLLSLRDIVMPAAGIAEIRRGRCYAPANFAQHYRAD